MERRRDLSADVHLVVVKVSIDGEAMLLFFLSLGGRLDPPLPPLDQGGVAHAAEEVGLSLQLRVPLPGRTQGAGLIDRRAWRTHAALLQFEGTTG